MSLLEEKLLPVLVSTLRPSSPSPHRREQSYRAMRLRSPPRDRQVHGLRLSLPVCPIQIHTFWIDAKNYVEVTQKWYAEAMPFPLNFFLPGRMQRQYMERLQLLCGEHKSENEEELEKEVTWG